MGLDVVIGLNRSNPLRKLLKASLKRHQLKLPFQLIPRRSLAPGRAYGFVYFAEYCRNNGLEYRHVNRITCSCWQMIVPLAFNEPIAPFAETSPQDLGYLWIPPQYGMSAEEQQQYEEAQEKEWMGQLGLVAMTRLSPSYPYYLNTPAREVFILSAYAILEEIRQYFETNLPGWQTFDFDASDVAQHFKQAAYLYSCCLRAIRREAVIWFDG